VKAAAHTALAAARPAAAEEEEEHFFTTVENRGIYHPFRKQLS
jgi:hypothetical protein